MDMSIITINDVGLCLWLITVTFIIVGILTTLVLEAIKGFTKKE